MLEIGYTKLVNKYQCLGPGTSSKRDKTSHILILLGPIDQWIIGLS